MSKPTKHFQWNAADYAKNSSVQQAWARELIAKLELSGKEALLDIGCGDGKITAEIAQVLTEGSVIGVDSSKEMVQLAKQNFPPTSYSNLSFDQVDAQHLNFKEQFDVIFSNAALHWVLDHKPILFGIYQALKPEGKVLVQMGGKGNAQQLIAFVEQILKESEWKKYFKDFLFPYGFYSPEEYTPWVKDCGLELLQISLIPKDMVYKSPDAFKGWFRTTWLPYLERVPRERQSQFIDDVVEMYLAVNPPNENGEISIKMQRLEFIAKKTYNKLR
ncbi:MAG: SAM-dependent methyltransferase [Desulfobulbus propionicus]|nr:MAG: SAM-dependent methyltransferase [Desulfobulbus propionicus]